MRSFIVLCLVAVACADKLGYNYQPVGHSDSGLSFAPGSAASSSVPSYAGDFPAGSNAAPSYAGDYSAGSNGAPSYSGSQGGDYGSASNNDQSYAPQGELEKEFYTFTANDDDFNDGDASNQYANSVKQGLRVVFIKGPENNGLENAALALAKHAGEQKTDIYVLNKQADISGLADKLNNLNRNNNHKPEVHFVKYRTPEDAANAQRAIQGQYDSLGGHSQNYNGGVAPVLNFASRAPAASHGSHSSHGSGPSSSYLAPASGLSSTYLPASIFRRFRL